MTSHVRGTIVHGVLWWTCPKCGLDGSLGIWQVWSAMRVTVICHYCETPFMVRVELQGRSP